MDFTTWNSTQIIKLTSQYSIYAIVVQYSNYDPVGYVVTMENNEIKWCACNADAPTVWPELLEGLARLYARGVTRIYMNVCGGFPQRPEICVPYTRKIQEDFSRDFKGNMQLLAGIKIAPAR